MALFKVGRYEGLSDAFAEFDRLQEQMGKLFGVIHQKDYQGLFDQYNSLELDVIETQEDIRILCNVPGLEKKDLDITLANNVLTLKGEKKPKEEKKKAFKNELWSGTFQRTISLPPTLDSEQVTADLADGLLRIRIGKRPETKPKLITVSVN